MKRVELSELKNKIDKKKLRIVLYIIVLAWIGVAVQLVVNYAFRDEEKMLHAFAGADSKVVESKLTLVANFGEKYMTSDDKRNMIDFVAGKLNIADTLEKEEVKGTSTTSMVAQKESQNAHAQIELISIDSKEPEQGKKTNQYLYVTVELYDDATKILQYKNLVDDAYEELGVEDTDAAITLQGTYEKELSNEEKDTISNKMLEDLQAKVVRENRQSGTGNAYTIYAYTPVIDDYINVEEERVNLNVVFTYNKSDNITTLYVATPILNTDY